MAQLALDDYPDRYALANELHARPFPELTAPCRALHLAIKHEGDAAERDRERDRAHLAALLDRYGAPHPPPGANHYSGALGRGFLKWEMHTEFVTYTLFLDGVAEPPFSGEMSTLFPEDWLAATPGQGGHLLPGPDRPRRAATRSSRSSRRTSRNGSCSRAWRSARWSTPRR